MMGSVDYNENEVAAAFTRQSLVFDSIYNGNPIIQYKRERVRKAVLQVLKPGTAILELNAGTGEDAIWFAKRGYRVHATDISEGMLAQMKGKIAAGEIKNISMEKCSFTELALLKEKGPYNHIFSNFGGLNCTGFLENVLKDFSSLLNPGGTVTLVIISPFCLWESLQVFRGRFREAFRRFFSKEGRKAVVEGKDFTCWYYKPSFIRKAMRKEFECIQFEGLCSLVPPSYMENLPVKFPKLFSFLKRMENQYRSSWPFTGIGDYFIISFRKKVFPTSPAHIPDESPHKESSGNKSILRETSSDKGTHTIFLSDESPVR
jgi:ubiquinone/menaquinone biosynthesis C-methylase UbiE